MLLWLSEAHHVTFLSQPDGYHCPLPVDCRVPEPVKERTGSDSAIQNGQRLLTSGANGHALNAATIKDQSCTVYSLIHFVGSIRLFGGSEGSVSFGTRFVAPMPRLLQGKAALAVKKQE